MGRIRVDGERDEVGGCKLGLAAAVEPRGLVEVEAVVVESLVGSLVGSSQ